MCACDGRLRPHLRHQQPTQIIIVNKSWIDLGFFRLMVYWDRAMKHFSSFCLAVLENAILEKSDIISLNNYWPILRLIEEVYLPSNELKLVELVGVNASTPSQWAVTAVNSRRNNITSHRKNVNNGVLQSSQLVPIYHFTYINLSMSITHCIRHFVLNKIRKRIPSRNGKLFHLTWIYFVWPFYCRAAM